MFSSKIDDNVKVHHNVAVLLPHTEGSKSQQPHGKYGLLHINLKKDIKTMNIK